MVDFKLVIGTKDGKSYQKEIKSPEADNLLRKKIGAKISGDSIGMEGYEFEITGGSDKAGFPMRKGIQYPRKRVLIGKSIGFSGKNRNKKKQKGLIKRRTVCGERITGSINQINLKVIKEGKQSLGEAPAGAVEGEGAVKEVPKEAAPEEKKPKAKPEEPKEKDKPEEEPKEKDKPKE